MTSYEDHILNKFMSSALAKPEKIALSFKNINYSYSDLLNHIQNVSAFLKNEGLKKGDMVVVALDRCPETIFSIFGVLSCGATYIPVDPTYAKERIRFIIEDVNARFVIKSRGGGDVPLTADTKHYFIEDIIEHSTGESPAIAPVLGEDDAAYIIYTSGSTGLPKGAIVSHKNTDHFLKGMIEAFEITSEDVFLSVSSTSFDASCFDYFLSLTNGATLVLADADEVKSGESLLKLVTNHKVTISLATPLTFKLMLDAGWDEKLNLKILSGGEPLPPFLASELLTRCSTLYNAYGPTETTVMCTFAEISSSQDITIGKAIKDTPLYFLDENKNPVKENEPGEIYIGGDGVGLGYLNRPDLTKERFLKDPFSENRNARMYKSGDIGIRRPDGNISYVGRTDNQVKVRGFRIELGEIEQQLSTIKEIKEAVVLVKENKLQAKSIIAYVKMMDGTEKEPGSKISRWKRVLAESLPPYMIPDKFVVLDDFPISPNGKIDRNAFPEPSTKRPQLQVLYKKAKSEVEKNLSRLWGDILLIDEIGIDDNFFELGGNSLLAQLAVVEARKEFNYNIPITKLYQYPTISGLYNFLQSHTIKKTSGVNKKGPIGGDVAIIGMECNFPGAETIEQFWSNLVAGKETVSFFNDLELDGSIGEELRNNANYVKARGVLNNVDQFDADFFNIHPRLAELMDPQQRLFLESSRNLLEKTGYLTDRNENVIGVFAGCNTNTYFNNNVIWYRDKIDTQGLFPVASVTDKDFIASRVAYQLNLNGPAVNVNSACSTSLLAVAEAVDSIRTGKCNLAIAGGAAVNVPTHIGHLYEEGTMLSADGHTRTFDVNAKGTIFSDGVGAVLLKSLDDAEKDGDTIYGVIKGVGVNNDGGGKGSFSAPSAEGQFGAINMAIKDADVDPSQISYIEAHGTATPLGDPIEIEGLKLAFGDQDQKQYCAIGSVKSNMGHLTHAAGVAGLIKTTLALHHKQIPASLHFENPNPDIGLNDSPFYVNSELSNWAIDKKRVAGVSSFGVGGTNVHVIVEEFEGGSEKNESTPDQGSHVIPWSAKNKESLGLYAQKLKNFIEQHPDTLLSDLAYTLQKTRPELGFRDAIVASSNTELIEKLKELGEKESNRVAAEADPYLVFMFPGQGSQFINMGIHFYHNEPIYKNAIDECASILKEEIGEDIREVIFAEENESSSEKLKNTFYTQPAIFVTSYAIAKLLSSYGISPTALVGHSIGEFVAAHLAGVFSLGDALKIVATRAKLISDLPQGSMLSVRTSVEQVQPFLEGDVSVAAINAPNLCVLSGSDAWIEEISQKLNEKDIPNKKLRTSHAFHSAHIDPIVQPLKEVIEKFELGVPRVPILSTVTGDWLKDGEATSADYWAMHSRNTVNFSAAIQQTETALHPIFLEVGPGISTSVLAKQHGTAINNRSLSTLLMTDSTGGNESSIQTVLAQLWKRGVKLDWSILNGYKSGRVLHHLPTYAFNKKSHWLLPRLQQTEKQAESKNGHTIMSFNNPIMPITNQPIHQPIHMNRKDTLVKKIIEIVENTSGVEISNADPDSSFTELGLDSLLITQIASGFKKEFNVAVTFRQLNEDFDSLNKLATHLDESLPSGVYESAPPIANAPANEPIPYASTANLNPSVAMPGDQQSPVLSLIAQQINLLSQQVALLQGVPAPQAISTGNISQPQKNNSKITSEEDLSEQEKLELKKPFGATAKIEKTVKDITPEQQKYLANLIATYNNKTAASKEYTQRHRSYMADPRVVSGFKPLTKEIVYSLVINKSQGCYLWDIDGTKYIDTLNGFGSNFLGYQADVLKQSLIDQIEKGYEIGPQHELAGEVCKMICDMTDNERSALCNTGSEAVLGAMRIARTITGKDLIVAFTGSYHGINDEVLVRGTKKLKTFAAASGILQSNVQNMLILDYGTPESLKIIQERINEIAAVLVEPVQSRRPEFFPLEYLKQLRQITKESNTPLIFDEVITGFRCHPGGIQALFGIKADLTTYGKVVGGGLSIGVIAGKKEYMDALDGGYWQYGDDSIPEVGVTYFAGTFVRHPLALATTKASLAYLKEQGAALQQRINDNTSQLVERLNSICKSYRIPLFVAHFSSLWKIKQHEEYPYQELVFALMRLRNIHIWDGFPCFITVAHTQEDLDAIATAFEESVAELCSIGFIPQQKVEQSSEEVKIVNNNEPPVPGARLGKDENGNPAWFITDDKTGKYIKISLDNTHGG